MGQVKNYNIYKKMKQRKRQMEIFSRFVAYLLLSIGGFVMTIPFIWMIVTSLKEEGAVFTYPPEWIPRSHLTTMFQGKEKKVYEIEHKGEVIKAIELSNRIETPAVEYTIVHKVTPKPQNRCKVIITKKNSIYGWEAYFSEDFLKPTGKEVNYCGKNYPEYELVKNVPFRSSAEREKDFYQKGLKVIIMDTYRQNYTIHEDKRHVIKRQLETDEGKTLMYKGEKKPLVNERVEIDGESVMAIKLDSVTYKPAKWTSTILPVRDSVRKKGTIQYIDPDFGDLSGNNVSISYIEKELNKTGDTAEDLSGEEHPLYTLPENPDKKFAIIEQEDMNFEPYGDPIRGVLKFKPVKIKNPEERPVQAGVRIDYKMMERFKELKTVKLNFNNYYKALFKAIPPVKAENLKGVSILTILLSIFGQIPAFIVYFINSITISVTVTVLELSTSCLAAYAFARLQWQGRDKVFLAYLATMMIPGQVTMIPVFIVIKKLGWIDTYKALILPRAFDTWSVFMLRQFFLSIPQSLEEAAYIDGATRAGILASVIMPLSKAALGTLAIFKFQAIYNNFIWPLIVTNSDYMKVIPVGLASFQGIYQTDWTLLMAATVIVVVPVLIVYIAFQGYVSTGIKLGAVKG